MRIDSFAYLIPQAENLGRQSGDYFIARIQSKKSLSIQINNGKTEEVNTSTLEGIAVQLFNPRGYMGFAAADEISSEVLNDLFTKASFLAEQSEHFGGEPNLEIFTIEALRQRIEIAPEHPFRNQALSDIEQRIQQMNEALNRKDPRLSVRSIFRLIDEEWCIFRTDGTDVRFNIPRSLIYHVFTAKSENATATTHTNISGTDLGILFNEANLKTLESRSEKALAMALGLLTAPAHPAGHFKMVVDFALAKGLAHEAFGHAAETDHLDSSILGEARRLKIGMEVANPKLSIIDGPLPGDHAYQPISAIGLKRQTVTIVDHGRLTGGLADLFSAASAGVAPTGAERVESFFHLPIARMSNIRIVYDDPLPLDQPFETVTPKDLYQLLVRHQVMLPGDKVLYLSGFQGGQVNPAFGDFVFHCSGIYDLREEPVLYKPAIFSGKVLSVLKAVSHAIGGLQLDAIGTCGKMGQGVPSCGGSHYFLVIDSDPEIFIGGESS